MKLYRCLTGPEGLAFNRRVTAALNDGWTLHGPPSLAVHPVTSEVTVAQVVVKNSNDAADYDVQVLLGGGD